MKKIILSVAVLTLFYAGCKDNPANSNVSVKDNDIANTIANSLGNQSNGFVSNTDGFVNLAKTGKMETLEEKKNSSLQRDTTIHKSGTINDNGEIYTWDYTVVGKSKFHLTNGTVAEDFVQGQTESADVTITSNGTYEVPVLKGNDNIAATLNIGGILPASSATITLGGAYSRKGAVTGKAEGNTFTYDNSFSLSNVVVSRLTKQVTGGGGTLKVTGSLNNSSGETFSDYAYSGTITFLGNNLANLDLVNDKTGVTIKYTIELGKGRAIRRF